MFSYQNFREVFTKVRTIDPIVSWFQVTLKHLYTLKNEHVICHVEKDKHVKLHETKDRILWCQITCVKTHVEITCFFTCWKYNISTTSFRFWCKVSSLMFFWISALDVQMIQKLHMNELNKTARIRAKPWMFRLPFKVYGAAVIT